MARSKLAFAAVCTLALAPGLGGCVGVAVVGGMAAASGAGYEAAQERGLNGAYDDFTLKTNVSDTLRNYYGDVAATVYGGRVLLTGASPTQEQKAQAEQAASRVSGVTAVYNEIEVAPPPDPWQTARDTWISTRVRSDMVLDPDVRSANYTIETDRQSVYLMGSARSQYELDRATQIARYVPGVRRVVSYVEIRTGVPVGSVPPAPGPSQAGSPAPLGGPASPPSRSPSSAPIQVQRL
ncbi:MAG TPA: BON domain-containing protein [Stellaceae bacterium]|nr:BON domain-containing protein [Stellaceae bacterium]